MTALNGLSIPEVAQKCSEENARYRRSQSDERGYCFELFRRAVVEDCQEAWETIYRQFER